MHFYCQCLNVTIDVLEINDEPNSSTDVLPVDISGDWLESQILSEQAVHIAWQSLFQSIPVRDMKLHRCLACNQYTHIVNNNQFNRIWINRDLLNDQTVEKIYRDPNYSKISKIILPNLNPSSPLTRSIDSPSSSRSTNELPRTVAFPSDDIYQRESELIQQIYRQSLENLDRETEERIRAYQREQETCLENKTKAINQELHAFLSFIRSLPRCSSSIQPLQTSNSYINENSMESGFGSDIFDGNGTDISRHSSAFEPTLFERASDSDDDSALDSVGWFNSKDNLSNFGTSLPKDIALHPFVIPREDDGDDDDLERIGRSFRELSQSLMCTDGTELFGDLPSPRLNARQT